jgi:hypothetical protein
MAQRPRPQEREEANGIFGLIAAQRVSIIGSDPKDVTGSVAYSRVRGTIPSTSWRKRSDLNRQHSHRQCDALPVELLLLLR